MNEMETRGNTLELHTLIPLEEFKSILNIDERDEKLSRFCLVTAAHTIEQYCMRRLRLKTIRQVFTEWQDMTLFLNEYPVKKIVSLSAVYAEKPPERIAPALYSLEPVERMENIPYQIRLSPAIVRMRNIETIKVIYKAGYTCADVPADLKAACLELAIWNMNRYKSKNIGKMSNEKVGMRKEGFALSMPENVRTLLEPYKRKVI